MRALARFVCVRTKTLLCQEKVQTLAVRSGRRTAGRVDLEVSAGGMWSGCGGMALTVLGSHCHGSISHFNELQ